MNNALILIFQRLSLQSKVTIIKAAIILIFVIRSDTAKPTSAAPLSFPELHSEFQLTVQPPSSWTVLFHSHRILFKWSRSSF